MIQTLSEMPRMVRDHCDPELVEGEGFGHTPRGSGMKRYEGRGIMSAHVYGHINIVLAFPY